jgi:RNA-directed DNA polymerase
VCPGIGPRTELREIGVDRTAEVSRGHSSRKNATNDRDASLTPSRRGRAGQGPNGLRRDRIERTMDARRQTTRQEPDRQAIQLGEAGSAGMLEHEASVSSNETIGPTDQRVPLTMEVILDKTNLQTALSRVIANKGAAGVDGMTVEQLPNHLMGSWPTIRQQLLNGHYKPQPVKRVYLPKPDGGERALGIPTVLDRFIQQALLQALSPRWEPTFSDHSYGFRPGRSAHQAVERAQVYITEGHGWVVDIDLEKFFDRVNHDLLMGRVMKRIRDRRIVKLIRAYLNAGVMEDGLVNGSDEGTPQGGPLSPLLSNLVLDELDKELEKRGHKFVRYADDCNIYVSSERAGQRVMEGISDFITRKLKLKVNASKSAVDRPSRRKFLGFSFTIGSKPKRRIAPKAIEKMKKRVRELTKRTRGVDARRMVETLSIYLRGWIGYFGHCQTPSVLDGLDSWIRRRLRAAAWKQWKRGKRRFKELTRRGVGKDLAAQTAGSEHNVWRISRSPALSLALPNRMWEGLGLTKLSAGVR